MSDKIEASCKDCSHCEKDTALIDTLLCTNRKDFVQVHTHEGAEIAVEPDFSCKGFKQKEY